MQDRQIRERLRARLTVAHELDPDTLILDELGIATGRSRADVVVVNGRLDAYEIKSQQDTVKRLRDQARIYSRVFDRATVVVAPRHLASAKRIVPRWWGIEIVRANPLDEPEFKCVRKARANPRPDPFVIAQMLWRDEVVAILKDRSKLKPCQMRLPRRVLWKLLVDAVSLRELRRLVRQQLRSRTRWRAV
jgi:hypothetical protein